MISPALFQRFQPLIEPRRHDTQDHNAQDHIIQFKHLAAVYDQIAQPRIGSEKFTKVEDQRARGNHQ